MMKYSMTIERTYRIGIEFDASNDKEAEAKAEDLASSIGVEIFDGDCESDYTLCDECERVIIDWA